MEIGVSLRNMGPQSDRETLGACARRAEALGFESIFVTDHIAIPPDDSEGSEGRYLDTLTTLAWLAGVTERIRLGSGVLILPYRPELPTAKAVATVQELSGDRLLLGVGVGWMGAEFRALGLDRRDRGRASDATLEYLHRCFGDEVMEANGQPFLFKPCPPRPPFLIGGAAPHAIERAIRLGDGWLPMARAPGDIAADVRRYRSLAEAASKPASVTVMTGYPLDDADAARAHLEGYRSLRVERVVLGFRYQDQDEAFRALETMAESL